MTTATAGRGGDPVSQTPELATPSGASTAPVTRAWLAVASLGAGLLHLATGAGAALPALVALVIFGAAEVSWAVACLARDRAPVASFAVYAALLPVGCWAAVATAGATFGVSPAFAALPAFPLFVASALDVAVALTLVVSIRRATLDEPSRAGIHRTLRRRAAAERSGGHAGDGAGTRGDRPRRTGGRRAPAARGRPPPLSVVACQSFGIQFARAPILWHPIRPSANTLASDSPERQYFGVQSKPRPRPRHRPAITRQSIGAPFDRLPKDRQPIETGVGRVSARA